MSIIRFSCDRDLLYVPVSSGLLVDVPYIPGVREGGVGAFERKKGFDANAAGGAILREHLDAMLAVHAASLKPSQPVVVMVHGFLFDPYEAPIADRSESDNPHLRIYHFQPPADPAVETQKHHTAWPAGLGFEEDDAGEEGLAVAFGWYSSPGLASSLLKGAENHYARAYDYGTEVAFTLMNLLHHLHEAMGTAGLKNRVDLFCHSLGSHVVVQSVINACRENRRLVAGTGETPKGGPLAPMLKRLERIVILGGAEYVHEAQVFYDEINRDDLGLKDSESCVVYNVGCRENDVLDTLAENFGPMFFGNSQVIGHNGLNHADPYAMWMDLQIDGAELAAWMKKNFALEILGDGPGIADHWHYYTHRPNMEWYKAILRDRKTWSIAALRKMRPKIPEGIKLTWWGN